MSYRRYQTFSFSPVWLLIGVNLVVFIATIINEDLFFLLGLQPASLDQHPWTILSSIFVHANFWHIAANMLTLYFFGTFLLGLVGEAKFWIIYLGGGILGSLLFLFLAPPYSIGVGASGAIFSLGGALAVLRPRVPVMVFPIPVPIPLVAAVLGGFVILSFFPGVAWQAHLGGIVFGIIAGFFLRRGRGRYRY